jgi:hypothetical protein
MFELTGDMTSRFRASGKLNGVVFASVSFLAAAVCIRLVASVILFVLRPD